MEEKKQGWWDTSIIEVKPNKISIKGYPIQDLMGRVSYGEMLYLMIMGDLPRPTAGKLVEAVLVAACDQGVISPAITVSRMAATCGVTFNSAIASGLNLLGRIHGGAIEEAMEIKDRDIFRMLEEIPDQKQHCIRLTNKTIKKAIEEYHNNKENLQGE